MDIYSYLNSPDVAAHCRKIGYKFNALESAFIVNDCMHISIQEKHRLYREIMNTMTDVQIEKYTRYKNHNPSLFVCLNELIEAEEKCLRALYEDAPGRVYMFTGYHIGKDTEFGHDCYYSDYGKMMDALKAETRKRTGEFVFHIKMQTVDTNDEIRAYLNQNMEVFYLSENYLDCYEKQFLDDIWVYIPTPFQKGDLVCGIGNDLFHSLMRADDPMVIHTLCYWNRSEAWIERRKQEADSSDMTAYGYWLDDRGYVYDECVHAYHNLQYYRGDIQPKARSLFAGYTRDFRLLKAISAYMKGEIHVHMLLIANDAIRAEQQWKEAFPGWDYLQEEYEKAGLSDIWDKRKLIQKNELKEKEEDD